MSYQTVEHAVGLSTGALYPDYLTEDAIGIAAQLGYRVTEVHLQSAGEYEPEFLHQLQYQLQNHAVTVHSIHCHTSDFDLWSPYTRRAAEMRDAFYRLIDVAAELSARAITWHGLWKDVNRADRVEHFAQAATDLAQRAKSRGVILTVENVSWCFMQHIRDIEQVRALGLPLSFTFDPFQAAEAGENPSEVIRTMGPDLFTAHLSDYSPGQKRHLALGDGILDWRDIFATLQAVGYTGPFIIETPYRGDLSILEAARDFVASHLDALHVR